jgi:predicted transglutaminase-like cysteine proteinase
MPCHDNKPKRQTLMPRAHSLPGPGGRLAVLAASFLLLSGILLAPPGVAYEPQQLRKAFEARWPRKSPRILESLDELINEARSSASDRDRLERINDFFNRRILFEDDESIWGEYDYWATPLETLATGRGDCEDIAIAKYYTLKAAGVAVAQMRLVYVRATIEGPRGPQSQAHMVVAWYESPAGEPLILDNLDTRIRPAGERRDLLPVFSFNSEAIWSGSAGNARRESGSSELNRWADLQRRARAEGFD